VLAVYEATKTFPDEERFGLVSQTRRSAYSVPSNVVEGAARNSKRDYLRFLNMAQASLRETEYFLMLARDLGYLSPERHLDLQASVDLTAKPLHGLIETIRKQADGPTSLPG
jgi:four helix bundle protein